MSVLFWTQLKHPPALEEKQLLEHFASKQWEKTTASCMGNIKDGTFLGKIIGKGEMKTDKTELHEGSPQPIWWPEPQTWLQSQKRGQGTGFQGAPWGLWQDAGNGHVVKVHESNHENDTFLNYRQRHKQNKTPTTWDFFLLGEKISSVYRFYSISFFKISTIRINLLLWLQILWTMPLRKRSLYFFKIK